MDLTSHCPYCDWQTSAGSPDELTRNEIAHMEANHPDVIEQRLRDAGELPPKED